MTNGTSQGLLVIVAIVIFGIFVGISYLLFGEKLNTGLANIFTDSLEQSQKNLNGKDNTGGDTGNVDEDIDTSIFRFDKNTGTILGLNFKYTHKEDTLKIPSKIDGVVVKNIDNNAFYSLYKNLEQTTKVVLPETIENIGDGAFDGLNLVEVNLPKDLKTIGVRAFYNNKLTSVVIPKNVKVVEDNAFYGNPIENLVLNNGLKEIGFMSFDSIKIKELTIPDTVEKIGENAFMNAELTKVKLPNNSKFTRIEMNTFKGSKLTNLEIPDSVKVIKQSAFQFSSLKSLKMSKNIEEIHFAAFEYSKLDEKLDKSDYKYLKYLDTEQKGNPIFK